MGKEFFTPGNIETEKNKFYRYKKSYFFKGINIEKVLVSNKIYFGEKTISILLVTCIKLSHYI